jgi:putative ATP-binding cassette transporter
MKLIKFLLRSSPVKVLSAILTGLIAGISNTGLLVLINNTLTGAGAPYKPMVWTFIALCLVLLISRSSSSILLLDLSRWAVFDLRMKLGRRIIATPLRQLEELGAPRLLATLTDDVPAISVALVNIPLLCMQGAVVLTCLIYLCWLSLTVFLGVLGFMVIGILTYQLPLSRGQRYLSLSRLEWDSLLKHIRALTDGAKELKLNRKRRAAFLSDQLEPTADQLRRHGYTGDRTFAIATSWGQLLVFILIGLLLYGLPQVRAVDARTLTGYTLVILYMMTPLEAIMNIIPIMGRANVAMLKVESLGLSLPEQPVEALKTTAAKQATTAAAESYESLELIGVTHSYYREEQESNFQLGPINLKFHPGELVFLIGGNGSGKTTFAKLLTGLYHPESGEIRLNGVPVTDENREAYRQMFSAVFSDFYLFEKLLGIETEGLDERVREYLVQLHLAHKVQVADGLLSTTDLSQGQRKRLALLSAYLEDRPFYVFDEWAADQDPLFKDIFYLQLLPELKARGKTVLVISHDDRYYNLADYLIKLDYGKVDFDKHLDQQQQPALAQLP